MVTHNAGAGGAVLHAHSAPAGRRRLSATATPFSPRRERSRRAGTTGKKKPSMSFATALEPLVQQPQDEEGPHHTDGVRGQHRHNRHRAHPLALERHPGLHRPGAGGHRSATYPAGDRGRRPPTCHEPDGGHGREPAGTRRRSTGGTAVYSNVILYDLMGQPHERGTPRRTTSESFKEFLEAGTAAGSEEFTSAIQYAYEPNFDIYTQDSTAGTWSRATWCRC